MTEYATRKGTRVAMLETVPMLGDWPEIPAGTEGTVIENTNTLAYSVVFDNFKGQAFTVGAYQVKVIYEPPTYADLEAENKRLRAAIVASNKLLIEATRLLAGYGD